MKCHTVVTLTTTTPTPTRERQTEKKVARRAGFEPARPEANGFQVHPVNHSGTVVRCVGHKLCYIKYYTMEKYSSVRMLDGSLKHCSELARV